MLSFILLVPGLLQPLLTITASLELMGVKREIFTETRSIIQTVRSLHESGNDFVAGLILLFSVIVPFAKATDNLDAQIHRGFYFFAAYCLVSIASLHFMRIDRKRLKVDPVG